MKGTSCRRIAGIMLCVAAGIWASVVQGPLSAKSCQEYCDSDYAACQTGCTDACGGYDSTCLVPCNSDCYSQYFSCSYGATTCNVQSISACDVTWIWIGPTPEEQKLWQATLCTTYMR
jgi:hypothetical protein